MAGGTSCIACSGSAGVLVVPESSPSGASESFSLGPRAREVSSRTLGDRLSASVLEGGEGYSHDRDSSVSSTGRSWDRRREDAAVALRSASSSPDKFENDQLLFPKTSALSLLGGLSVLERGLDEE